MNEPPPLSSYVPVGMAPPPIAPPTAKSQEMVLVRRSEIESLKRAVKRAFDNPIENANAWASAWLGVAVTAAFSLIALIAVKDNEINEYILSGHVATIVGAGFLAGYLTYLGKKNRKKTETGHEDVVKDLDELLERAPTQIEEES